MPGIPREHVNDVWDMAEPMIKKATDRMPGGYRLKDLKSDCLDGSLVLWMGRNAKCALLIKVSQYHLFKSCVIILIGGEDYNSWIKELREIEEYASPTPRNSSSAWATWSATGSSKWKRR